jgi:hypothetical protein
MTAWAWRLRRGTPLLLLSCVVVSCDLAARTAAAAVDAQHDQHDAAAKVDAVRVVSGVASVVIEDFFSSHSATVTTVLYGDDGDSYVFPDVSPETVARDDEVGHAPRLTWEVELLHGPRDFRDVHVASRRYERLRSYDACLPCGCDCSC